MEKRLLSQQAKGSHSYQWKYWQSSFERTTWFGGAKNPSSDRSKYGQISFEKTTSFDGAKNPSKDGSKYRQTSFEKTAWSDGVKNPKSNGSNHPSSDQCKYPLRPPANQSAVLICNGLRTDETAIHPVAFGKRCETEHNLLVPIGDAKRIRIETYIR
ncbi:uncharacterized protein J4E79_004635 [Alternaria viburni]|uniref:uncharacterized protein n=1 Tax=Alternaria viburni TaxID=566460 RepID=UPI0020C29865|nr:uncharacterized protein J4E79_004635 [Alternaria viburni]KAI4662346.1 hypothetical protein J4E79_004635 [Alternaria viburni]